MNVKMQCNFILSKKLEKIVGQGEPLYLQIESVQGNKGTGWIRFWTDGDLGEDIAETSIMIRPTSIGEEIPDFSNEVPTQTIFCSGNVEDTHPSSPVRKLAKTDPDEEYNRYASPWTVKCKDDGPRMAHDPLMPTANSEKHLEERPQPEQMFSARSQALPDPEPELSTTTPEVSASISDYSSLMDEISDLGDIDSYKPPKAASGPKVGRTAAVEMETKGNMAPRIKKSVYIANRRGGMIEIADIGEKIMNKEVMDLSRIEAQKLRDSRDLKWCLDNGILEFTDRREFMHYIENRDSMLESQDRGLKAYSGVPGKAAERAAQSMYDNVEDPMVDNDVWSSGSSQSRISQAARSKTVSSNRTGVIDNNDDILDIEGDGRYEDPDDSDLNSLVDSMDPSGLPSSRVSTGGAQLSSPSERRGRSIPRSRGTRSGSGGPKNIRKV